MFNSYGQRFSITATEPEIFPTDNITFDTYSISISNGTGLGVVIDKESKTYLNVAVSGAVDTKEQYEMFFETVAVTILTIDNSLSDEEVIDILSELGYGNEAPDIDTKTTFSDGTIFEINYIPDSNSLEFLFTHK